MKKYLSVLLVMLMMMLAMAGCGGAATDEGDSGDSGSSGGTASVEDVESAKTFGDLIALDVEDVQSAMTEKYFVYAFRVGDDYYRARTSVKPETSKAYFDISFEDDDYEKKQNDIVGPLEIEQLEHLNDQILSEDDLAALVGKTGKELVDEGWTYSGSHMLEDMTFWMDYGPFEYAVKFDGSVDEADYEDYDDEAGTIALKVTGAEFSSMGDACNIEE